MFRERLNVGYWYIRQDQLHLVKTYLGYIFNMTEAKSHGSILMSRLVDVFSTVLQVVDKQKAS